MPIGVSSSCFYPLLTEKSFEKVVSLGVKESEIFFNSPSELSAEFICGLKKIKDENGITVTALHPMRSFSEGYDLFSSYERRFYDALEFYKKYFAAAGELGAKYIVIHGAKNKCEITKEEYAKRYAALSIAAKNFGCDIAHENVVHYVCENVDFMRYLKDNVEDFKAVLDVKQARRAGVDPLDFIKVLGESIVHVHLSDYNEKCDCTAPSENGRFDFYSLFCELKKIGYNGRFMVELYSSGFGNDSEIVSAVKYLRGVYNSVEKAFEP